MGTTLVSESELELELGSELGFVRVGIAYLLLICCCCCCCEELISMVSRPVGDRSVGGSESDSTS